MIRLNRSNFWNLFGKVAFVFAVLWFFGLLFNFMLLMQLIGGVAILGYGLYVRFKGKLPTRTKLGPKKDWYAEQGFTKQKGSDPKEAVVPTVKVEPKKPNDSYEEYMQVLSERSPAEQA